jgi:hypothetical protein
MPASTTSNAPFSTSVPTERTTASTAALRAGPRTSGMTQ